LLFKILIAIFRFTAHNNIGDMRELTFEEEQQEKMRDFLKNILEMENDQNPESDDVSLERKLREFEAQLEKSKNQEDTPKGEGDKNYNQNEYDDEQGNKYVREVNHDETGLNGSANLYNEQNRLNNVLDPSAGEVQGEENIPFFQKQIQNTFLHFGQNTNQNANIPTQQGGAFDFSGFNTNNNTKLGSIISNNETNSASKQLPDEAVEGEAAQTDDQANGNLGGVKIKILNPNDIATQNQQLMDSSQLNIQSQSYGNNQSIFANMGLLQNYGINSMGSQAYLAQANLLAANPLLGLMQGQVNPLLSSYNILAASPILNPLLWQQHNIATNNGMLGAGGAINVNSSMSQSQQQMISGTMSPNSTTMANVNQQINNGDADGNQNQASENNEITSADADSMDINASQRAYLMGAAGSQQQHLYMQQQTQHMANSQPLFANKALFEQAAALKKSNPESSVFVKNISPNITVKELETAFSIYGKLNSCRIAVDLYGQSLGYAYLTYETKESAEECIINANNALLKDTVIQVQPFVSKINRIDARNNLYVKNLPTYMSEEQLNQKLMEIFGRFGPITSSVVKLDKALKKPFAFICFENHIYADLAFKALHDTDPFKFGSRLYISWAEKKVDRVKRLAELHAVQQGVVGNPLGYQLGGADPQATNQGFSMSSYLGDFSSQGNFYMSK
jgi:RNA recognition motif-containing protein